MTHLFSHYFPESPVVPVHFGHYNRSCYYYCNYPILTFLYAVRQITNKGECNYTTHLTSVMELLCGLKRRG